MHSGISILLMSSPSKATLTNLLAPPPSQHLVSRLCGTGAMESGFVLIEDSPQRPEASSSALPGPEWALQPYTFRTRIAVPENNAVTKDFERRISKGIIKIVRHDFPEGTILLMDEILARLQRRGRRHSEKQLRRERPSRCLAKNMHLTEN